MATKFYKVTGKLEEVFSVYVEAGDEATARKVAEAGITTHPEIVPVDLSLELVDFEPVSIKEMREDAVPVLLTGNATEIVAEALLDKERVVPVTSD